jgi:hypothetical protein
MSFRTEFARTIQPARPSLSSWLTAPLQDMKQAVRPLFSLGRRSRLPRLSPKARQQLRSLTPEERELCRHYATLLQDQPELAKETGLEAQTFLDLLELDAELGRLIQAAGSLAQAAADGTLVCDSTLSALNARVLVQVEETLEDPETPRAERDRLLSIWGEWYRSEQEAETRELSQEARRERRLSALRKELRDAEESAQVLKALGSLSALPPGRRLH